MMRRTITVLLCMAAFCIVLSASKANADRRAYGRVWGNAYGTRDWNRFYHYPYVFYPQNFWGSEYYRSAESLYYRYPPEMRVPVYNKKWQNHYPEGRRYHYGHHFMLDVF
ncbi:MAG: calmodulin-binding protein [Pirellulaceae bacterium]